MKNITVTNQRGSSHYCQLLTAIVSKLCPAAFFTCALFISMHSHAQTTLVAGDIAVIGVNTSFNVSGSAPIGPDEFAIVTLTDISSGTNIKITDHGWNGSVMLSGTVADGILSWTTTAAIPKGTVFKFTVTAGAVPAVTISPNSFGIPSVTARWTTASPVGAFGNTGDQVIIYQGGTDANPGTFIYGFNSSASTATPPGNWQTTSAGSQDSNLPPGLTNNSSLDGTVAATAIAFTNNAGGYFANNFVYTGTKAGSRSALLQAIANRANWSYTTTLTTTYDLNVGGANFAGSNPIFSLSTLPVQLINFSATQVSAGALLQWDAANEESFARYEIEQSNDGKIFNAIGSVAASGRGHYQFIANMTSSKSYYRLKLVDADEHFAYSRIVLVLGKSEQQSVRVYPNPATDIIYISSGSAIRQYSLMNVAGVKVLTMPVGDLNTISIPVQSLPRGIYLIEIKTEAGNEREFFLKQ